MGEIRSTLDIIMEKARDVKVTEADKAAFMRREVEGKVRGVLQKYLDGVIHKDRLNTEVEALGEDRHKMAIKTMKKECLDRLTPDGDNDRILDILGDVMGLDTKPVHDILLAYQNDQEETRNKREAVLRERLADQGISGSSVVPNLGADPEWVSYLAEERNRFDQRIASLMTEF